MCQFGTPDSKILSDFIYPPIVLPTQNVDQSMHVYWGIKKKKQNNMSQKNFIPSEVIFVYLSLCRPGSKSESGWDQKNNPVEHNLNSFPVELCIV